MYFHYSLIPRGAYFLLPLQSKQEATSGWNFTKCISEVKVNQLKVKNMHVKMGTSTFNIQKIGRIQTKNTEGFQNNMQPQWHQTYQEYGGCQIWVLKWTKLFTKNREPPSEIEGLASLYYKCELFTKSTNLHTSLLVKLVHAWFKSVMISSNSLLQVYVIYKGWVKKFMCVVHA